MAVRFNGTTSKLENTTVVGFDNANMTIVAWVFPIGVGEPGVIFTAPEAGIQPRLRHDAGANTLFFTYGRATTSGEWTFPCTDGRWNPIAVRYTRTADTDDPYAMVDFAPVTITEVTPPSGAATGSGAGICVGNSTTQTATWDGSIAYLQVFNVLLNDREMNQALLMPGSVTRGLVLYLPLWNPSAVGDFSKHARQLTGTTLLVSQNPPIGRDIRNRRNIFFKSSQAGVVLTETNNVPGSRNFDGAADKLIFQSVSQTVLTACAWVNLDSAGNSDFPRIFDSPAYQFYFGKDTTTPLSGNDNTLKFSSIRTVDGVWNTPASSHANSSWVHCAVAYDSASTATVPFMWLNGVFQTVATQTPPVLGQVDNAGSGYIGNNAASDRALNGKIAHLMLFNRQLTDGEIKMCMRLPGSITSGLTGYWPMFGDASPEADLSGNKRNATLVGTNKFNGPPIARHNRLVRRAIPTAYRQKFNYAINETLTLTLTEAQSKDVLKVLLEALTLAHPVFSPSKDTLKGIVQALTLSESLQKDILKSLTQSITLTESQAKDFLKVLINNMSLTESHGKDTLRSILQALSLSESLSKDTLKAISQSITITESHSLTIIGTVLDLIEFLVHGNIETHDKIAMIRDLITTALNKSDFDMMENDLVLTGRPKIDDDTQETDTKKLLWDWHN